MNNLSFFRWGFGEHDIEDRSQSEEEWTDEMNTKFSDLSSKVAAKSFNIIFPFHVLQLRRRISAVFIDTHYKKEDPQQASRFNTGFQKKIACPFPKMRNR